MKKSAIIGPSALVTAAFIGPGTLTVCTIAGVQFGYDLIWVLVFATGSTVILQGMAARLGLVTGQGLGEALRGNLQAPWIRYVGLSLVFVAIIVGNAAYEMGNVTGALLGLKDLGFWGPLILGGTVFGILWTSNIRRIQNLMALLVLIMSLVFVTSAFLLGSFSDLISGLRPSLSTENQLTALALVGTTIVPYNLFLHASAMGDQHPDSSSLSSVKKETLITISIGGLISVCVLITAASAAGGLVQGIADMSRPLDPLLGSLARPFISIGIFAAGISSSLTAPLAAALTAQGIFGWKEKWKNRVVWGSILLLGVVFSMLGFKPISVIQIAQVANGVLLPVVVFFLLMMCNKRSVMGSFKNSLMQNILGIFVWLVSLVISFRSFNSVFHFIS